MCTCIGPILAQPGQGTSADPASGGRPRGEPHARHPQAVAPLAGDGAVRTGHGDSERREARGQHDDPHEREYRYIFSGGVWLVPRDLVIILKNDVLFITA